MQKLKQLINIKMEKYELLKPLGEGSSGMVFEAKIKKNKEENKEENKENVAIKCIFKLEGYDNKNLSNEVKNEIKIMKLLENENKYSIKLLDYFEDSVAYYLVEELMPYNLCDYINKHELTSENIKKFIHQFCEAYSKLIEYDIEHNDISLRNILINDNFDIKLCDYNCSKIINCYNILTNSLSIKIKDFTLADAITEYRRHPGQKEAPGDTEVYSYTNNYLYSQNNNTISAESSINTPMYDDRSSSFIAMSINDKGQAETQTSRQAFFYALDIDNIKSNDGGFANLYYLNSFAMEHCKIRNVGAFRGGIVAADFNNRKFLSTTDTSINNDSGIIWFNINKKP